MDPESYLHNNCWIVHKTSSDFFFCTVNLSLSQFLFCWIRLICFFVTFANVCFLLFFLFDQVEHLPILIDSPKKLDHQLSSDPDNTPVSNAANSDSETDDISQPGELKHGCQVDYGSFLFSQRRQSPKSSVFFSSCNPHLQILSLVHKRSYFLNLYSKWFQFLFLPL